MSTTTSYADGVLTVSRLYDAPRDEVFDAWIETSKVEQWWGCAETEKVRSEIEPRVGGKYNHVMTIKNVGDHPAKAIITEYEPPARLAYEVAATDFAPKTTVTVDFIEENGGTRVTLLHSGLSDALGDLVKGGWSAGFEKLDRFLLRKAA